jgi:ATP-binding cassette, subfamily B, bacterial PglK
MQMHLRGFDLLLGSYGGRAVLLLPAIAFGALLEMVGLAAVPAFVAVLAGQDGNMGRLSALEHFIRVSPGQYPILGAAVALASLIVAKNGYLALLIYAEAQLVRHVAVEASARIYRGYLFAPYTFHLSRNPADLIRTIAEEIDAAIDLLRNAAVALREAAALAVVFLLLLLIEPVLAAAVFVLVGLSAAIFYLSVRNSLLHHGRLAQHHRGARMVAMGHGLNAAKETKAFGREHFMVETFTANTAAVERYHVFPRVVAAIPRPVLETLAAFGLVAAVAGLTALGMDSSAVLPLLALVAVAMVRLIPAFNAITSAAANIRFDWASFILVTTELQTVESLAGESRVGSPSPDLPLTRSIRIENLRYRYPGAAEDAIRGISLEISPGEAIAVVGPSGAGKTTLVDLLLGLLEPTSGRICVDGQDIGPVLPRWRQSIGYVPQDVFLLDDTIRRNIAFGLLEEEIDDEAVERAVGLANLTSFVTGLPDGVNTRVGHRGALLSGGQRQRIGIARALYHDPAVIILDEATSALDSETERAVVDAVSGLRPQVTLIVVAHRLSTVRSCDRVYLMEDGIILDHGPVDRLSADLRLRETAWNA